MRLFWVIFKHCPFIEKRDLTNTCHIWRIIPKIPRITQDFMAKDQSMKTKCWAYYKIEYEKSKERLKRNARFSIHSFLRFSQSLESFFKRVLLVLSLYRNPVRLREGEKKWPLGNIIFMASTSSLSSSSSISSWS